MKTKGRVKFTDFAKGYGYILSEDANDPTDTVLFTVSELSSTAHLHVGSEVVFDMDPHGAVARNVYVEPNGPR